MNEDWPEEQEPEPADEPQEGEEPLEREEIAAAEQPAEPATEPPAEGPAGEKERKRPDLPLPTTMKFVGTLQNFLPKEDSKGIKTLEIRIVTGYSITKISQLALFFGEEVTCSLVNDVQLRLFAEERDRRKREDAARAEAKKEPELPFEDGTESRTELIGKLQAKYDEAVANCDLKGAAFLADRIQQLQAEPAPPPEEPAGEPDAPEEFEELGDRAAGE